MNARELHVFLDSGQEFANWIKSRIADFGFIDGQDFLTILSKTPNGGRPSREYYISLDMAKELSMVERNDKGRQARRYFIECEKDSCRTGSLEKKQHNQRPAVCDSCRTGSLEMCLRLAKRC